MEERIQKLMAENGMCSRRAAEQIIQEGRVKVNGHPVKLGDKMDPARDLLSVDGKTIRFSKKKEYIYLMLHKPRGFITTVSDDRGRKTVMDLLKNVPERVFPIGRLDKDSEGLLLFTNDGDFAHLMMHPAHGVSKLYRVTVRPHAAEEQIVRLTEGVMLEDGMTSPAVINVVTDEPERTVMEMTIKEGRNRQIRRMCEAVGLEVIRLKRNCIGAVKLGMLQPGEYRMLKHSEVNALRAAAKKGIDRQRTEQAASRAEHRRKRAEAGAPMPRRRREHK